MRKRIISIGELLFDLFPDEKRLGGAPFNFAFHLHRFGQEVAMLTRIGNDSYGREMQQHLRRLAFPAEFVQIDPRHATGTVKVTVDNAGAPTFEIVDAVAYDFLDADTPIRRFMRDGVDLIYFGTLAQRHEISRQAVRKILQTKPANALVFYDVNLRQQFYTKEIIATSLALSDIVKLNQDEFELVRALFAPTKTPEQAAKALIERFDLRFLCITRGENGSALYTPTEEIGTDGPQPGKTKVVDTVGAGDAYAAVLAYGILAEWPIARVARDASSFAAAICTIAGAIPDNEHFYSSHAPRSKRDDNA